MFNNAIVLTGGIATGKSTVARILKENGFNIIDADEISHKILDENHEKISKLFGTEYVFNKKVQRKKLGSLIFSNKKEKEKLENLLHPLIKEKILLFSKVYEKNNEVYLIDIPLFFENKTYNIKKSILVYATKEQQFQRLIKRDKFNSNDALARIDSQIDINEKKLLATYIIDNTNNIDDLKKEVTKIKEIITK